MHILVVGALYQIKCLGKPSGYGHLGVGNASFLSTASASSFALQSDLAEVLVDAVNSDRAFCDPGCLHVYITILDILLSWTNCQFDTRVRILCRMSKIDA